MPIADSWWVFGDVIIASERELPGVYELGNATGEVVYIGSASDIRRRLREHWLESSDSCVKRYATQYRVEYCSDYLGRLQELYELHVNLHCKPPLCSGDVDVACRALASL